MEVTCDFIEVKTEANVMTLYQPLVLVCLVGMTKELQRLWLWIWWLNPVICIESSVRSAARTLGHLPGPGVWIVGRRLEQKQGPFIANTAAAWSVENALPIVCLHCFSRNFWTFTRQHGYAPYVKPFSKPAGKRTAVQHSPRRRTVKKMIRADAPVEFEVYKMF